MSEAPSAPSSQDKLLTCVDCGAQFVFSARDQAFYQERGYQAPRRCKGCREKRKSNQHVVLGPQATSAPPGNGAAANAQHGHVPAEAAGGTGGKGREMHKVSCSACGIETTVPFKPDPNRPVYCRSCYVSRRKGGRSAAPAEGSGPLPQGTPQ